MNFEGLDPGLAEFSPAMHSTLDPVLDAHLNPSLLQNVELDPEGVALEALPVQESVHIMEGPCHFLLRSRSGALLVLSGQWQ